jgi:uncharacterized protein YegJ (DUF2314 family)
MAIVVIVDCHCFLLNFLDFNMFVVIWPVEKCEHMWLGSDYYTLGLNILGCLNPPLVWESMSQFITSE